MCIFSCNKFAYALLFNLGSKYGLSNCPSDADFYFPLVGHD